MSIDTAARSSRRTILTAAGGALAGVAASVLGRAAPLRAANGDPITVGGDHSGSLTTKLANTGNGTTLIVRNSGDGDALFANAPIGDGDGISAQGRSGVIGLALEFDGLRGYGPRFGVQGIGGVGVRGSGDGERAAGVYGSSGGVAPSEPPPNAGVFGWSTATGTGNSWGVYGRSTAPLGFGVVGQSATGTGVLAASGTGFGLSTLGRVSFDTSGLGTIPAGSSSMLVDPDTPFLNNTRVLVTLHGNPGGNVVLQRVARSVANDTFTVHLTGAAANDVLFSWFVIG